MAQLVKNKGGATIKPSPELYEVVLGVFRAQGTTLFQWMDGNDVSRQGGRMALIGQWGGERGTYTFNKILDAADRETVAYLLAKRREQDARAEEDAA